MIKLSDKVFSAKRWQIFLLMIAPIFVVQFLADLFFEFGKTDYLIFETGGSAIVGLIGLSWLIIVHSGLIELETRKWEASDKLVLIFLLLMCFASLLSPAWVWYTYREVDDVLELHKGASVEEFREEAKRQGALAAGLLIIFFSSLFRIASRFVRMEGEFNNVGTKLWYTILFMIYPLGVWSIQPRINLIYEKHRKANR